MTCSILIGCSLPDKVFLSCQATFRYNRYLLIANTRHSSRIHSFGKFLPTKVNNDWDGF
jgi:hypothetical protein